MTTVCAMTPGASVTFHPERTGVHCTTCLSRSQGSKAAGTPMNTDLHSSLRTHPDTCEQDGVSWGLSQEFGSVVTARNPGVPTTLLDSEMTQKSQPSRSRG